MAPRIQIRPKAPRRRPDPDRWYFYAGEVARILKLDGLDYRQLRALFRIVREQAGSATPDRGEWARFTFRDLVALRAALLLAGGEEALAPGRRLRLKDVAHICRRLREGLGIDSPLTEVAFRRRGKTVVARAQNLLLEPASGQLLIAEVQEALERYFAEHAPKLEQEKRNELRAKLQTDVMAMKEESSESPVPVADLEVAFW